MGQIQRLTRGHVKPYNSVPRIDWEHPLAVGLSTYCYDIGGSIIDLVNGGQSTQVATSGSQESQFGRGLKFPLTGYAYMPPLPASKIGVLGGTAPFSCAIAVSAGTTGASEGQFVSAQDSANTESTTFGFSSFSPNIISATYGNALTQNFNQVFSAGVYNSYAVVADASGSSAKQYGNGVFDTTFSGTTTFSGVTSPQIMFNTASINAGQTFGGAINGFVFYFAMWGRALSVIEVLLLHQDPYCFLIYPEDEMLEPWVGSVALLPHNKYDWPNPEYQRPTYFEYTRVDRRVSLIGKDLLPHNQYSWPVPASPIPGITLSTWIEHTTYLIGKDILPKNQYSWPNPNIPVYYDDYSWDDVFSPNLIGKDKLPKNIFVWNVPLFPPPREYTWLDYVIPAGQDALPTGKQRWIVPYGPIPPVRDWIEYTIPAGQDKLPVGKQRWVVPYGPIPPVRDWVFDLNPPAFPIVQQRDEVPLGPPPNPFWIDYIIPAGQDKLPTRQYVHVVPRGPYYPDQTFYQYVQQPVFFPEVGQVWFVPSQPFYPDQTFYQYFQPIEEGVLPPGLQVWTVPADVLRNSADWINFLTNIPQPLPPVELVASGRYISEAEVEASKHVKWRYKEGADSLYKHMAAVNLGRKGGIESGKSRRGR